MTVFIRLSRFRFPGCPIYTVGSVNMCATCIDIFTKINNITKLGVLMHFALFEISLLSVVVVDRW